MSVTEDVFRASILPFTLKEEGGLSTDREDPGNWTGGQVGVGEFKGTKYGIAASSHPDVDIRNLTLAQACDIYWAEYMVKPAFTNLDPGLACVVFDCGVNCGPGEARKLLRPILGTGTLDQQIISFSSASLDYHERLRNWPRYGAVWGRRIAACQTTALHIAISGAAPAPMPAAPDPSTPRLAPKVATQPVASWWTLLWRAVVAQWGSPQPQAA